MAASNGRNNGSSMPDSRLVGKVNDFTERLLNTTNTDSTTIGNLVNELDLLEQAIQIQIRDKEPHVVPQYLTELLEHIRAMQSSYLIYMYRVQLTTSVQKCLGITPWNDQCPNGWSLDSGGENKCCIPELNYFWEWGFDQTIQDVINNSNMTIEEKNIIRMDILSFQDMKNKLYTFRVLGPASELVQAMMVQDRMTQLKNQSSTLSSEVSNFQWMMEKFSQLYSLLFILGAVVCFLRLWLSGGMSFVGTLGLFLTGSLGSLAMGIGMATIVVLAYRFIPKFINYVAKISGLEHLSKYLQNAFNVLSAGGLLWKLATLAYTLFGDGLQCGEKLQQWILGTTAENTVDDSDEFMRKFDGDFDDNYFKNVEEQMKNSMKDVSEGREAQLITEFTDSHFNSSEGLKFLELEKAEEEALLIVPPLSTSTSDVGLLAPPPVSSGATTPLPETSIRFHARHLVRDTMMVFYNYMIQKFNLQLQKVQKLLPSPSPTVKTSRSYSSTYNSRATKSDRKSRGKQKTRSNHKSRGKRNSENTKTKSGRFRS